MDGWEMGLGDHALRVHLVLVLLSQAVEIVDSEKEDFGLKNVPSPRSGQDGKTKNGMARQIPDGSSQPGKTEAKAHTNA